MYKLSNVICGRDSDWNLEALPSQNHPIRPDKQLLNRILGNQIKILQFQTIYYHNLFVMLLLALNRTTNTKAVEIKAAPPA